jgi:hypothetical protein
LIDAVVPQEIILLNYLSYGYKMPGHNLLLEAGVVGATIVPVYGVVCSAVDSVLEGEDKKNPSLWMLKVGITGALYHLLSEAYGMNDWFLRNSVASQKADRARTEDMLARRADRYNYSNYAVPEFPDKDKRNPMNDPWVQGSWTTSPAGMPINQADSNL